MGFEGGAAGCRSERLLYLYPATNVSAIKNNPPPPNILAPRPEALGRHVHLELYQCPVSQLTAPATAQGILRTAAQIMRATIVGSHFHAFSPYGVSGVVIIAESHLTIHTWPEHQYAAVDVFSCGDLDLEAGLAHIIEAFGAERHEVRYFDRGFVVEGQPSLPTKTIAKP